MDKTIITLRYPVEGVTELHVRRAKVRDEIEARRDGGIAMEVETRLLARMATVPPSLVEGMDVTDYLRLQGVYMRQVDEASAPVGGEAAVPPTPGQASTAPGAGEQ